MEQRKGSLFFCSGSQFSLGHAKGEFCIRSGRVEYRARNKKTHQMREATPSSVLAPARSHNCAYVRGGFCTQIQNNLAAEANAQNILVVYNIRGEKPLQILFGRDGFSAAFIQNGEKRMHTFSEWWGHSRKVSFLHIQGCLSALPLIWSSISPRNHNQTLQINRKEKSRCQLNGVLTVLLGSWPAEVIGHLRSIIFRRTEKQAAGPTQIGGASPLCEPFQQSLKDFLPQHKSLISLESTWRALLNNVQLGQVFSMYTIQVNTFEQGWAGCSGSAWLMHDLFFSTIQLTGKC